ncbi:MAG: hypothetical protein GY788_07420 [bacterium]|nr:hypothetical protein [bacterium]
MTKNAATIVPEAPQESGGSDSRRLLAGWQPMDTAPLDGTSIQAEIPGHGKDNILFWMTGLLDNQNNDCGGWAFVEDQEPPPCWTDGVCWEMNDMGEKSIDPTRWKPLSS